MIGSMFELMFGFMFGLSLEKPRKEGIVVDIAGAT